jgi:cell division protein FtsB
LLQRVKLEIEKRELEREIEQIQIENSKLRSQINMLETDLKYIEKIAREKYGMVKDGEVIYKIIEK